MHDKRIRFRKRASGLRENYLSYPEVLAQSIAAIAPTGMPVAVLPLVFANAGNGSWLAYVLALFSIVLVCLNLNQFTRRMAAPGSLYGYVAIGLGQLAGFLAGWSLILGYVLGVTLSASAFANYANVLLHLIGWQGSLLLLYGICISVAGYIAYRDIKFSTVSLLLLEAFSIGLILLLAGIVMWQHHLALDLPQLTLQGSTWSGMTIGLVLALLSFVGFESAATLGDEAVCPRRTIPQALLGSTIASGVFFIVMAYVIVLGFRGHSIPLSQSDAPLSVLANLAGIEFVGTLIALTAMVSGFAGTLANLNAAGRILLALAQQRIVPRWLGKTHQRNDTPHLAIALVAIVAFLIAAPLVLFGVRPLDILGYTGALLTDGYLIVYLLLAIAAPLYLRQLGQLRSPDVGIGIGAGVVLLIPIVNSIYPVPPAPYSFFPYLFLLWLVVGAAWFLWLLRTRASINIIAHDWYSQSSETKVEK